MFQYGLFFREDLWCSISRALRLDYIKYIIGKQWKNVFRETAVNNVVTPSAGAIAKCESAVCKIRVNFVDEFNASDFENWGIAHSDAHSVGSFECEVIETAEVL